MLNMNRPERWGLFCSLLFGEGAGEGRGGRSWARVWGAVCDLATVPAWEGFVSWMLSLPPANWWGGPQAWPLPLCQVQMLIWATRGTEVEPGTQGMCACPCILAQLGTAGSLLGELGLGWAQTLGVRCCGGLWVLVSLCSPLPPLCIHRKRPVHYMQLCCQPTVLHGKHTTWPF